MNMAFADRATQVEGMYTLEYTNNFALLEID